MAAVMEWDQSGVTMESGQNLDKLIVEQEKQLENAQHRLVVELASSRLGILREMQRRLLVDRSLMRVIPSTAAKSALDDVFHDFDVRVKNILDSLDDLTQKLIVAYSDREEHEEAYERAIKEAMHTESKWFRRGVAAKYYQSAAESAKAMADAMDRVLQLRKEMLSKEQALKQGQEKILGLIEEFIDRYQEKHIRKIADESNEHTNERTASEASTDAS